MAKPNLIPEWASGNLAQIAEPPAEKKALGWVAEMPPFQFFNWLMNLYYQWIVYFDGTLDTTITALATEVTARTNAITAEALARTNADTAEALARSNAITAE